MNPEIAVSDVTFTVIDTDLVISYNIKVNGANAEDFLVLRSDYRFDGELRSDLSDSTPSTPVTLAGGTDGNYTATIDGGAAYGNSRYLIRVANSTDPETRISAVVVGDYPSAPDDALVSSAGCSGCHGNGGNGGFHYGYPASGATCTVCHDATNVNNAPYLMDLGHSLHASHLMPSGEYSLKNKDGTTWLDDGEPFIISATYPSYLTNCSVCHSKDSGGLGVGGALAEANKMEVTTKNCFSCHESMESWEENFAASGATFHNSMDETTDCQDCHITGGPGLAGILLKVTDFHNGLETERIGIIYGGEDLSVTEGAKFNWTITEVVDDKASGNLTIKWTAEYPQGTSINPCNTTASPTAPLFYPYGPNTANEG
ncbi:MAG TPA: hypothetical protein VFI92_14535, partial [Steroidobacteraceae bacterium]|nr:hypothetical protein [Steroidobacteraceae bacterium]